jgi:hypothetical protein
MFTLTVSIDAYAHTVPVCLDFPEILHDFSEIVIKDTLPKQYELKQIMKIIIIKYVLLHCIVT